ncbi:MAG TPA: DUF3987 domain-containing protein [Ktedonobacterales bacterium]|nr:DUF3987 domain-containing protein [Ktedonobacterales bacterium]
MADLFLGESNPVTTSPHVGISSAMRVAQHGPTSTRTYSSWDALPDTWKGGRLVAFYNYHHADSSLAYVVRRYEKPALVGHKPDKECIPFRPIAREQWVLGLPSERVLYRLPKIISAPLDVPIFLTEGEKAADALQVALKTAGLPGVVTTTQGGSDAAKRTPLDPLQGRRVVILPDNDDPGRKYGEIIAERARKAGATIVVILDLGGLPEKGDIVEWLDAGHTGDELGQLAARKVDETSSLAREEADEALSTLAPRGDPFPLEALPHVIARYVKEASVAIGAPIEYLALPALAAASVAIGASVEIELKRGWRERAALWLVVIGQTGTAKSPAQAAALAPIDDHQRELKRAYDKALKRYEELPAEDRANEPPPQLAQVITTDATVEALADVLQRNPRGVVMVRDELSGLVRSLNQYKNGKGSDREHYLSLWSGARVIVNRRGRGAPLIIERPVLNIVGAIPPDILSELADERGREDGFIHRFLFAWPGAFSHRWTRAVVSDDVSHRYDALFRDLFTLQGAPDLETGERYPDVMSLTGDAQLLFEQFYNEIYEELEGVALSTAMRGPLSKMPGHAARLALVLHWCRLSAKETTGLEVDAQSMRNAIQIANYFISHARRVYAHLATRPEDARVANVLEWMRIHQLVSCTARDLTRAGVAGVHTTGEAEELLSDMATARGLGRLDRRSGPGRPTEVFTLHASPDN